MKRFQNRVAESHYSLPCMAVVTMAVCVSASAGRLTAVVVPVAMLAMATALTAVISNRFSLMRIFSRMASVSLLALSCCALPVLFQDNAPIRLLPALLLLCYYRVLFDGYQNPATAATSFTAYVFLGIAVMAEPYVLVFLPVMWSLQQTKLMALNIHTFVASLLGLAFPFWTVGLLLFYASPPLWTRLTLWFHHLTTFPEPFGYGSVPAEWLATGIWILLLFFISSIHFLIAGRRENVKTRLLYQLFISMGLFTAILLILWPQQASWLLPILTVNTAFLVGHLITFTSTRVSNIFFVVYLAVVSAFTTFHLWTSL